MTFPPLTKTISTVQNHLNKRTKRDAFNYKTATVIFGLRRYGELYHYALCGLFGESGMEDVLKIKKGRWKSSKSCSFRLCSIGPTLFACLNFLLSQFLSFCSFPFIGAYLCIFHVYLGCISMLFSINHLFIKKKKKKL
jgi:hypothetical protein